MTRAYVLDPVTRATLGLVDQSWERLSYVRRYFGMDTFELAINRSRLWASELQTNRLLYLPDEGDLVFLIEQIASVAEGSTRNDAMTVTGRSLEGIAMAERLVEPPAGQSHDRQTAVAAETAIKHYLRAHAADLAAPARVVPGLAVAPDSAVGPAVTVAGRYQTVFDLVREIGLLAGIGWEITYDPLGDAFVFDVVVGADRSASVFFDFAFETLERTEELDSVLDSSTVAVVAGQGEGAGRDIVTRWSGAEPAGFARREAFLDARDVELGATTTLAQRGDAFLEAAASETRLEAGIHQYGAFRYGQHWDLGDLVLVRHAERGISYAARVVEVETVFERSAAAPEIRAVIDRPFPTMRERVEGSGARGGAVDSAHHDRAHDHAAAADGTALAPVTVAISSTGTSALTIGGDVNLYRGGADLLRTDDSLVVGGSAGITLGPDVNLYRGGADLLRTDDSLVVGGSAGITLGPDVNLYRQAAGMLRIGTTGSADEALQIGDDSILFDVDVADRLGIKGVQNATTGGFVFGSGKDTNLYRSAADVLATDDSLYVGNELRVANNVWHRSLEGSYRVYYGSGSRTYFGSGNGYEWRSAADTGIAWLENDGRLKAKHALPYTATSFYVAANASLTLSTSVADVSGCSVTFTPSVAEYLYVWATVDFDQSALTTGSNFGVVELIVDGAAQAAQAIFEYGAANLRRATVSQMWVVQVTGGASHTIKLRAYKTAANGTCTVNVQHTTLAIQRWAT